MSFGVDDPYELISIANSLKTSDSESALLLIMYVSERFDKLGSTVRQFSGIPRDQFDSVVRDDFEPRLLEVGTDSADTGESLIGMASALKQFYDQVPRVKSAAANLEQVLNQSSSPAEWKAAAEPLANELNNLYSVKIPPAPSANQALAVLAKAKDGAEAPKRASPDPGARQGEGQPQAGATHAEPAATAKQPSGAGRSEPAEQAEPAARDSGSGGGSGGGDQGGGSGSSPAGAAASAPAGASDTGKKATKEAAPPGSSFGPIASTGLQSADLAPLSSEAGLGGAGGGIGAGGLDPKRLGAAPGGAAGLTGAGASLAAGPVGAARGMSSTMGGMMGSGMMGGRGGEKERKAPDYLYSEDNGYELIEKLPVVSPDVIGALTDEEAEAMELQADFAFSDQR